VHSHATVKSGGPLCVQDCICWRSSTRLRGYAGTNWVFHHIHLMFVRLLTPNACEKTTPKRRRTSSWWWRIRNEYKNETNKPITKYGLDIYIIATSKSNFEINNFSSIYEDIKDYSGSALLHTNMFHLACAILLTYQLVAPMKYIPFSRERSS